MTDTGAQPALQRKLALAKSEPHGAERTALRALRLALARAAEDVLDLPLAVIGATQSRVVGDAVAGKLGDDRLLILLDGPDRQTGAVTLDETLVTALIQQQTMGKVLPPRPSERDFTETDAALSAPLVDDTLNRAAQLVDGPADRACLTGFQFGARADDARSLALALDADRYRVFDLTIDIGAGVGQGALVLILPDQPDDALQPEAGGEKRVKGRSLHDAALNLPAELSAVLCRLRVPLSELSGMKPGDCLHIAPRRLEQTELVSITGQKMGAGRLGQADGFWAIRLGTPPVTRTVRSGPEADGFVAHIGPLNVNEAVPTSDDPDITIEAHVGTPDEEPAGEVETDLANMTPEQAAAEISELAGLSASDLEDHAEPSGAPI